VAEHSLRVEIVRGLLQFFFGEDRERGALVVLRFHLLEQKQTAVPSEIPLLDAMQLSAFLD
jgi:hypothetical protein